MRIFLVIAATLVLLTACEQAESPPLALMPELPVIQPNQITVSGLGDGAFMASQLHLALNERISGLAVMGGGLYFCAQGQREKALGVCRTGGRLEMSTLTHAARDYAAAGKIATLNHLDGDRVWALHGRADNTFSPEITYGVVEFYEDLGDAVTMKFVEDVGSGHGIPTLTEGHLCERTETPFLNECDYDAAGELLQFLTQKSADAVGRARGTLQPLTSADGRTALAYIPPSCGHGYCQLHVALHTCGQSTTEVGERFAKDAGYNRWADALGLVVLYPQAPNDAQSRCWDWGNGQDPHYATRMGTDVKSIASMIDQVTRATAP